MNKTNTAVIALLLSVVTLVSTTAIASADERGNQRGYGLGGIVREIKNVFPKPDVQVGGNGATIIQSAVITAVSNGTYTATTTLGASVLTWTITTDSATKFLNKGGKTISATDVAVGDTVTVRGAFVSGSTLSLKATSLRDHTKTTTVTPVSNGAQQIFEGNLTVVPGSAVPTTLTMVIGGSSQVVSVNAATVLLNKDWAGTSLPTFVSGDVIRVFGYIPGGSSSVTAIVLRNTTR